MYWQKVCQYIFFLSSLWVGVLTSPVLIRLKFRANLEDTDVRDNFSNNRKYMSCGSYRRGQRGTFSTGSVTSSAQERNNKSLANK